MERSDENIELSLDWVLKNRYAANHPDPNLAGAVINTRLRHKKEIYGSLSAMWAAPLVYVSFRPITIIPLEKNQANRQL